MKNRMKKGAIFVIIGAILAICDAVAIGLHNIIASAVFNPIPLYVVIGVICFALVMYGSLSDF